MAGGTVAHGIARYIRELVKSLEQRPDFEVSLLVLKRDLATARVNFPNQTLIGCHFPPFHPGEHLELPWRIWKVRPDLVHFPSLAVTYCPGCPYVTTVHDLIPQICYPSKLKTLHLLMLIRPLLNRAQAIFCDSQHTANDVVSVAKVKNANVCVGYVGVEALQHLAVEGVQHPQVPPEPYLLVVSNPRPHKNNQLLLEAFQGLELPLKLVLVCKGEPHLDAMIARDSRVVRISPMSDEQLAVCMSRAWALCMPSLYEGFGLPPLEAMTFGTPTIVARAASLPEVVGQASLLFDPHSVPDLQSAITRLWEDPQLSEQLRTLGPAQAAGFSWQRITQIHVDQYLRIMGRG
jgi:glycosyltransferase involved in cell wall biosynthesis